MLCNFTAQDRIDARAMGVDLMGPAEPQSYVAVHDLYVELEQVHEVSERLRASRDLWRCRFYWVLAIAASSLVWLGLVIWAVKA